MTVNPIRLQKYLASCGVASRRKSEEIIKKGRVKIDGKIIKEMGIKILPSQHKITVDDKIVLPEDKIITILLNKPTGYITTLADPQGRPVVTSLTSDIKERIFPVGRLDFDTSGALILTNNGKLAQKIQHPSNETNKTYLATIEGEPTKANLQLLRQGIMLEGRKTSKAEIILKKQFSHKNRKASTIQITIHEGRKRQVRKMFKAIGHNVFKLKRISYGKLTLGDLKSGSYRHLSKEDINKIFQI